MEEGIVKKTTKKTIKKVKDTKVKKQTKKVIKKNVKNTKKETKDAPKGNAKDAPKGKQLNSFQHILHRPEMYIGSTQTKKETKWIFDEKSKTILQKEMKYNEGLERIFIEVMSNAIDNVWRSEENGTKQTFIHFTLDEETGLITVKNDGRYISVKKETFEYVDENTGKTIKEELYPAELYFGRMRSGTNYDDSETERKTSGRNGVGIKATNVFSKEFTVVCVDPENGLKFTQKYYDNLTKRDKPKITKCSAKKGYTEISYLADFSRFGFKDSYTEDFKSLIKKNAYDCAMWSALNVSFNGNKISIKSFPLYVKLYYPEKGNSISFKGDNYEVILTEKPEESEFDDFTHTSFINGIYTKDGGTHVESWKKNVVSAIVSSFNSRNVKKGEKPIKLTQKDVSPYFHLFVRYEIGDPKPKFESQQKHKLTFPPIKAEKITDSQLKKILKWNFVKYIEDKILEKQDKKLSETDGKRKLDKKLKAKLSDANEAGNPKRKVVCTLILTEGDSAKTFADSGISTIPDGKDIYGTFPLRGKVINATNKSEMRVNDNEEIKTIKGIIGLKHKADYSKEESRKQLRYDKVMLLTDADTDGFHISGLVLDYFYENYPSLVEAGFVSVMRTPIIKVFLNKKEYKFYTENDFHKWKKNNPKFKQNHDNTRYYKGLGTSNITDICKEFPNRKVADFETTDDDEKVMKLGFDKDYSNERKDWITSYNPNIETFIIKNGKTIEKPNEFEVGKITIPDFVNNYLITYHVANVKRELPNVLDGLRDGARKILYSCFLRKLTKIIKVAQLAGYVSEQTSYEHGEASLQGSITKMGQGFVGSNNIPFLKNEGQFGSRYQGGKDCASARYIYTALEEITRYLFPIEDDELLERRMEDTDLAEPKYYVPILPTLLINGSKGIASGFSTTIAKFNPLDLCEWIKVYLGNSMNDKSEKEYPKLEPWYRGFKGKVIMESEKKGYTEGIIEKISEKEYRIKELPIGLWHTKFKEFLEDLEEVKKIKSFKEYFTPNTVNVVIYCNKLITNDDVEGYFEPNIETNFKCLRTGISYTNMYALDEENKPVKFNSPEEILEKFCGIRYKFYEKRKINDLRKKKKELIKRQNKYRFIKEISVDETLVISKRKEEDVLAELEEKGYDKIKEGENSTESYHYLVSLPMNSLTVERMEKLKKDIEEIQSEIKILENTSESDMWLNDIEKFKVAYTKFLKTRIDDVDIPKKKKK